jgi:diguanylate cyclase (GGDEF)-like protein
VLLAGALDAPHGVVVIAAAGSTAYTLFRAAHDVRSGLRAEFGPVAAILCALPLALVGGLMMLRLGIVLASGTLQGHGLDSGAPVSTRLVLGFMASSLAMNFAMGALVILRLVNRLSHLSQHDALTQLVNRRGFEQRLEAERARLQRGGRPFALISLDVDHFKSVNDRHGHGAGDQVLVGVARVLEREARAADVVARTGGEEFSLLLPASDLAGARQFALRLLAALRGTVHEVDGERLRVTASIGLGLVDDAAESEVSIWRRVDAALYRAKAGGRDRVETAP